MAQRAAADTAREALDVARRSFRIGNSGVLDVDAERRYAQAQLGLSQARVQRWMSCNSIGPLGGGLPPSAVMTPPNGNGQNAPGPETVSAGL